MTDIKRNSNRNIDMLSTMQNIEEYIEEEHATEDTTYLDLASAVSNTLHTIDNEQYTKRIKIDHNNIKTLQGNICKPVSVALVRLSEEICKKDLYSRIKTYDQNIFRKETKKKHGQIKVSRSYVNIRKIKIPLSNGIDYITDTENEAEKTSLDLDNQRKKQEDRVQDMTVVSSLDGYKLRSRNIQRNNYYDSDNLNSIYSSSSSNYDIFPVNRVFQSKKNLNKWKYKRKHCNVSSEESINTADISTSPIKRRKIDFPVTHLNITNAKVILTKLEDMHDNKHVILWKKKLSQALLTKNLQYSRKKKMKKKKNDFVTNTVFIKTVDSSYKDITREKENNISAAKSLSPYVSKPKYKQSTYLKVLLVKLETLGVSLQEQNLASKIEQLTAKYNDLFKFNFLTHPNIVTCGSESNTVKNSINEASAKMSFAGEENEIINKDPTNKSINNSSPQTKLNKATNLNISPSKSILQDVYNSEALSEKSELIECQELTGIIEYTGLSKQPTVKRQGSSALPKAAENLQTKVILQEILTQEANLQKSPEKVSKCSSPKKTNFLILSHEFSVGKLKEIQKLPLNITSEEHVHFKRSDKTSNSTDNINCETIEILQNRKKTIIDKSEKCTLQKYEESSCIDSLPQLIMNESSTITELATGTKNIGSLTETFVIKETPLTDSSNNVEIEADVNNTNLSGNLTTKLQTIDGLNSVNSDITLDSEQMEQFINDSFRYTCIACNTSFKEFRALPLHLKQCLAKSKERRNTDNNSVTLNVSADSAIIAETLKSDNIPKLSSPQSSSAIDSDNKTPLTLTKKALRTSEKSTELTNKKGKKKQLSKKQSLNEANTQCTVCSEVFDTMISLSNHIYTHTQVELQEAYEIAKKKQTDANASETIVTVTADKNEKTEAAKATTKRKEKQVDESSKISSVKSMVAKSSETILENKRNQNVTNKSASTKKMQSEERNPIDENKGDNTFRLILPKPDKQVTSNSHTTQSSNISSVKSTVAKSSETILDNKKNKNVTNKSASTKEMQSEERNAIDENIGDNTFRRILPKPNKQISNSHTIHEQTRNTASVVRTKSIVHCERMTFCECHKSKSNNDKRIELVLRCNICRVIFRSKECFEGHFKESGSSLCNAKRLIGIVPRLYCSACEIILYSFIDMRQHVENHVKNHLNIKLFCHICKIRFIGMGPIFNIHWFNHMRNVSYTASRSTFPKLSLVDSTSRMWSIITSDEFKYLVITEHVCSYCNEQFFASSQLQNHIPYCPKREEVALSHLVPASSEKDRDAISESNLRLFCSLCKVTFTEKSLFETHTASHKQQLQPQYICLSMTDVQRMYICNICANVYKDLKEFGIHWQDHNTIRENFMCNQCNNNFPTLEIFMDHSKQCNISTIPVDLPSCQVSYHETNFSCKICNIGFESHKALYQHSGIHKVVFPRLGVVQPNEGQNKPNARTVSSSKWLKNLEARRGQLMITSNETPVTTSDSNVAQVNESTPQISKDSTHTCNSSISSTDSKLVECFEIDFENVSTNDSQSITDVDTEILSLFSEVGSDDVNVTQEETCFGENNKSNDSTNKVKENEVAAARNMSNSNSITVITSNSKEKIDVEEVPLPLNDININEAEMDDDVVMIETGTTDTKKKEFTINKSPTKMAEKNNDILREALTASGLQSEYPSESNESVVEKSVKVTKYLRVKNISELMDQKLKYTCPACYEIFDTQESLKKHSRIQHTQRQNLLTNSKNIPILSAGMLSEKYKRQNVEPLNNPKLTNLQQGHPLIVQVPNFSVQPEVYNYYNVSQMTQRYAPRLPPYTTTYTVPTQDPNIQHSSLSSRPVMHNSMTNIHTNVTHLPTATVQPQMIGEANEGLNQMLSSSNPIDSSTNNVMSNNYPTQRSNNVMSNNYPTQRSNNVMSNNYPTQRSNNALTVIPPNLLPSSNVVPNKGFGSGQLQDTHSRIKLQNAVHQTYANRRVNLPTVNVRPKTNTELAPNVKLKQTTCLPVSSSNQYRFGGNASNVNDSFMNVPNTQRQPQQNNPMMTVNTNVAQRLATGQISAFHQPPTGKTNGIQSITQKDTIYYRPSTTPSNGAFISTLYKCHYCPKVTYFATIQELDDHLNVQHNYICDVCNERMFNSNELDCHRIKHDTLCLRNIFQS